MSARSNRPARNTARNRAAKNTARNRSDNLGVSEYIKANVVMSFDEALLQGMSGQEARTMANCLERLAKSRPLPQARHLRFSASQFRRLGKELDAHWNAVWDDIILSGSVLFGEDIDVLEQA